MQKEFIIASEKIKWNKQFRKIFLVIFSSLNCLIFVIQLLYIYTKSDSYGGINNDGKIEFYRCMISIIGMSLFLIDCYMTYLYIKTMMKYIELMHHDENKRRKLKYLQILFSFLMIMRGVSENIIRTGS